MTTPTDDETTAALAAALGVDSGELLAHAVESVRIPCHRLPSCILGPDHEGRCVVIGRDPTETPKRMTDADVARLLLSQASLTTEQARVHATRWADALSGTEPERTAKIAAWLTLDEDRERLFAWARAYADAASAEGLDVSDVASNLAIELNLGDGESFDESLARDLLAAAGWPS